jgi:hypothetical protein
LGKFLFFLCKTIPLFLKKKLEIFCQIFYMKKMIKKQNTGPTCLKYYNYRWRKNTHTHTNLLKNYTKHTSPSHLPQFFFLFWVCFFFIHLLVVAGDYWYSFFGESFHGSCSCWCSCWCSSSHDDPLSGMHSGSSFSSLLLEAMSMCWQNVQKKNHATTTTTTTTIHHMHPPDGMGGRIFSLFPLFLTCSL